MVLNLITSRWIYTTMVNTTFHWRASSLICHSQGRSFWSFCWAKRETFPFGLLIYVVYFDQLSGAACTWKLIETFFCWFQPWNHWKSFEMIKKGWKMAEKNVSTSFPVCASPESWSKYTTYTHKMCTCTPTIDHFVGSFWPQNKFVPKFGPFAKKVAILGFCYAVKQLTIIS